MSVNHQPLKIGLDVDGVLADFSHAIISHAQRIGLGDKFPKDATSVGCWDMCDDFRETFNGICNNRAFWSNVIPLGHAPDFTPTAYVAARPIDSIVTKMWLSNHGMPTAPVITVDHPDKKIPILEDLELDVFVDDYYGTITKLRDNTGILGLLFEAPYQRGHTEEIRNLPTISELSYDKISEIYQGWIG